MLTLVLGCTVIFLLGVWLGLNFLRPNAGMKEPKEASRHGQIAGIAPDKNEAFIKLHIDPAKSLDRETLLFGAQLYHKFLERELET